MRLHLTSFGIAVAAATMSSEPAVLALRTQNAMKAMEVNAAAPVECTEGQQTLGIKAANDTVSFRCGTGLALNPPFAAADTQAYTSTNSTSSVLLTSIIPNANFTQTTDASSTGGAGAAAREAGGAGAGNSIVTYHLNAPELPKEEKTVVFKCTGTPASTPALPEEQKQKASGQEGTQSPAKVCLMIINVAKSAASIAATPAAAAGSIALAVLASSVAYGL
ncbi:hypothetical protein CSUI_000324 [Cystoisospora suis]|uniref:SRS domain-containing protein n=1 Tax=Cystoisospora suis TaxID=483139 RepID=A0A2C6LGW5_9APIC|nr:hypothetical protein CSUI_000324 [Cystoisospora suis]